MGEPQQSAADGAAVVAPNGRLDIGVAPAIREHILGLIRGGATRVVMDMRAVVAIDSTALGTLIACLKEARQVGGDLRIVAPGPKVRAILEWTNLGRILKTYDSVEAAVDDPL